MQPKKDSIIKIHTHPIKAALLGQNEPDPTEWMDCFHELPATSRQRYWVEQWAHNLQAGQSLQLSPSEQEIFYFWQGLSPQTYAQLGQTQSMTLDLPKNYPIDPFWQYWGRDGHHTTERIEDEHALSVLEAEHTICFRVQRKNQSLTIHWQGPFGYQVHQQMVRLLNLSFQAPNWPADLILSQSQDAAEATRPFLTRTVWEAILWVILGQQINLSFAYQMRSNLYRNLGQPVGHDLYAAPHPKSLLETPLETFRSWQISRQKASTLLAVAAVWPELAQLS
ncbi:MAG: hypothetical protein KDC71_15490, partial [Acidobacteria bacterium]|nr:hypothetical protein [Acidobacteriota bacterium]